jgi:hypothetical protein
MNGAGKDQNGPRSRIVPRPSGSDAIPPKAAAHLVWRETILADGTSCRALAVPDDPGVLDESALPGWLARHQQIGAVQSGLAVLVIRETLDRDGLIRECSLERRRGSAEGPFDGDPARIEFVGPARMVRLYRALPSGRLAEIAGHPEGVLPGRHIPEQYAGEIAALRRYFGADVQVLDTRDPTLFESMAGLENIFHVWTGSRQELGCGIGWHGPIAFVLAAAFPRLSSPVPIPEEAEHAIRQRLANENLVRHETRIDKGGFAVIVRRRGTTELFMLRPVNGGMGISSYHPAPESTANPDQINWMRFAETYEHLVVLDAWQEGGNEDLVVITGETNGHVWRHNIDAEGVEVWRKPDPDAAAGILHREKIAPGVLAEVDRLPASPLPEIDPVPAASDTILGKIRAHAEALSALDAAIQAAAVDPPESVACLRRAQAAFETLGAEFASAEAAAIIDAVDGGQSKPECGILRRLRERLLAELASTPVITIRAPDVRYLNQTLSFSNAVFSAFPSAAYDIEEAGMCLALRRPTAAALHTLRGFEAGLSALGLQQPPTDTRQWTKVAALFPGTPQCTTDLRLVQRVYASARWNSALRSPKFTDAEAARLFAGVGRLLYAAAPKDSAPG